MDLEQFLQTVATRAPDLRSQEDILRAADAALGQLSAYVSGAAAERLAAELPAPLRSALTPATTIPEGGESHEFYAGVAAREGTEPAAATAHAQAVLRAIAETVPVDTVRAVGDQLTPELRGLLSQQREGDTAQLMSAGPVDPDAPKLAGPDRPAESRATRR